ncbi:MAG: TetR/AcrR family transcriptional regulator [Kofleriaceae bacterium]|nr:TetR/AcrR family transcriptional regulator [Kofleriaceae bacterium]MCB9572713.1 TetR/AcrR family transcriptional regulator [Kofleriaceae bacterium]
MIHGAPRTPRAKRRDASLQRILDEAMALVARDGLDGLSMARLAQAADYTPGALYRYFDSKDALLSRLVERILGDIRAVLDEVVDDLPATATPLTHVIALAHAYRRFARLEPHRFGLLAMTMAEPRILIVDDAHAAPAAEAVLAALRPLAAALTEATAAGELGPAASPATAIDRGLALFAALQGALQLAKLARFAPGVLDVARLSRESTRTLLIGWGADAARVDAAFTEIETRFPLASPGGPT